MANFEKAVAAYKEKGVTLSKDGKEFVGVYGDIEFADENLDVLLADMDALVELGNSDTFTLLEEVGDNDESIIEFEANGEKHQIENASVADALREAKALYTEMTPPPSSTSRRRRKAADVEPQPPEPEPEAAKPARRRGAKANGEAPAVAEPVAANAEFKSPVTGVTPALVYAINHMINSLQALRAELVYADKNAEEPAAEEPAKRGRGRPRGA